MTIENLHRLAKKGQLGDNLGFADYCMAAAIDACFTKHTVPKAVYAANYDAATAGEIGCEGDKTDLFYTLLGRLVFNVSSPETFAATPYYFSNLEELTDDLGALRHKATILLDTNDGLHSVGLRPSSTDPENDKWHIVGKHQIIVVRPKGEKIDVQDLVPSEEFSTEDVWQFLQDNNSPGVTPTALIFPPEPA